MAETIKVPVVKAKGQVIEVELDKLPDEVYKEILLQGAKAVLNRGMTKISSTTYPKEDELKAAAMEKAAENLEAMYEGKIRITGGKAKKGMGKINTEARRIARNLVKDLIKQNGGKVGDYENSEISRAAQEMIDANPEILKMAEENIKARESEQTKIKFDLSSIAVSDKKVAAAKAKKERKVPLSATQAGIVQAKAKPGTQATAH